MTEQPPPPIAVHYEHPDRSRTLFAELARRGTPQTRVGAARQRFDPAEASAPFALLFKRVSAPAYPRDGAEVASA